jgi:hypothetical protein
MDTRCSVIKLNPGSMDRVREWAKTVNDTRRDEALSTLRDETIVVESAFLWQRDDGDYLVYFTKAENMAKAREAVQKSTHAIDAYHQQFQRDTWESNQPLELLVDLDRIHEGRRPE